VVPVSLLFVCVHNAGRSQMAAAFASALGGAAVEVRSAGSTPSTAVNPTAVEAMREIGIDVVATPQRLTDPMVEASDVVVTMGCGDVCPVYPGKRYEDWVLDDPAGQPLEVVRGIRDDIRARVVRLLAELGVSA
jgi:protein-tyrosine-phosphatase